MRRLRRQPGDRVRDLHRRHLPPTPGTGLNFAYCDYDTSWLTQAKLTGSYTLPWQEIQVAGVLQNLPGQQILAQWNIVQADADAVAWAGRCQAAPTPRAWCRSSSRAPRYTPRRTQLDLRLSKTFRVGGNRRLQAMADVFNLTNSNAPVGATSNAGEPPAAIITTYGSAWLRPLNVLQARYVKFGAQLTF